MAAQNLLQSILAAQDGRAVEQLAARFGLDRGQTESAMRELLPALSSGMKRQASSDDGLRALAAAVDRDGHDRYLDDPALLREDQAATEGNGILGHLLGSKDASRAVAARASERTGLGDGLLKQMLPVLASLAMGAVAKNMRGGQGAGGGGLLGDILSGALDGQGGGQARGAGGGGLLGGILGGLMGGGRVGRDRAMGRSAAGGLGGLAGLGEMGRMFDADDDGSSADDLLEAFFSNRR